MLPFLTWLIQGGVGPALVALPVNWASTDLAGAAKRWFRRLRRSDGLSRIVQAAAGDLELCDAEFAAVRRLLEKEGTWVEVGCGTVEDLAALIASCLPGRTAEGSLAAGRAIAGGLLEFAVRDLEPDWFQQVLFARLERMQTDQASALDQAMLSVHADLAALFALQDTADADRFALVMAQLGRVLDRLPPGPADRGELEVYLARLVNWLNTDPWPEDTRFGGPALTPAAIERKLRITSDGIQGKEDLDADDLARQSARLVILGGPGSGKTWLARRTARLGAETALHALAEGAMPGEVELPLYTTCSQLSAAPPGHDIRRAIVSSAFGQLPDLGGSPIIDSLRVLFEERNAATLLVADSLDEASAADDRIRQADTLPPSWRIVLTSRPASWNYQLAIGKDDPARRVGVLQPLRYPDDVEAFIAAWFSERPAHGAGLAAQLWDRPALQQAATVPLILTFYCIVGGDQPLPARRADLYTKVIRRMLTGRWRGSRDRDPDPDACLEILRDWAWSAAARDPVSGVGAWADEFPTPRVRKSEDDRAALDHIAPPLGLTHPDTGMTQRRFVHRSLREHLTAEHIALRMPAEQAACELLNHLWYDPDWEYAAPAALAMHPQRDQVLKELMCRATGSDQLHAALTAVDGCWEIRRFLARVAQESGEDDWMPEAAQIIGQARLDLATALRGNLRQVLRTAEWPTSTGLVKRALLGLLNGTTDPGLARQLAETVDGLKPTAEERAQAREALLGLLAHAPVRTPDFRLYHTVARLAVITVEERAQAREALLGLLNGTTDPGLARQLAETVARLNPTTEEQAQAREALLGQLARTVDLSVAPKLAETVARLNPTTEERAQAREALIEQLARTTDPWLATPLAKMLARLDPTAEERTQAREALIGLLARETDRLQAQELAETVVRLAVTAEERARAWEALLGLLARETNRLQAQELAETVVPLAVTAEERGQAREALLGLLNGMTHPFVSEQLEEQLAEMLARLDPTAEEQAQAREVLLGRLNGTTNPNLAAELAKMLARLDPTAEQRAQAREALLGLLTRATGSWLNPGMERAVARLAVTSEEQVQAREALLGLLNGTNDDLQAQRLAETVTGLDPTADERAQAREALLGLLNGTTDPRLAGQLAETVARLDPTAEQRAQAREALIGPLNGTTDPPLAGQRAETVSRLDPTAEEQAQARETLLGQLARTDKPPVAQKLAETVARLDPTAEEQAQARETLLTLFAKTSAAYRREARDLADRIAWLAVTAEERARTRDTLIGPLARTVDLSVAQKFAETAARLAVTEEERAQAREALLGQLTRTVDLSVAQRLAETVARLAVTEEERARSRETLIRLLARTHDPSAAWRLAEATDALNPTVADLSNSKSWPVPPTSALLAAARQNSGLPAWLAALPLLSRVRSNIYEFGDVSAHDY